MPEMNGADVAGAIRAHAPELPIVFITGYADTDAIDRSAGPKTNILRKPFRVDELQGVIAEALKPRA